MAQLFSEMCRRAKVDPKIIAAMVAQRRDFDVDQIAATWRQREEELRSVLIARAAYTKQDVSTPLIPNLSFSYDPGELVADLVFPLLPGNVQRKFPVWKRRDRSRIQNVQIASDGQINEAQIGVDFSTYTETPYGEKQQVDLNAVAQAADGIDLFEEHIASLMGDLMLARENRVASLVMTAGNYAPGCTSALTTTNRWDVGSGSTADPLKDIRITAKIAVGVGVQVNALVASTPVLEYLRTHPKVTAAAGASAEARVVTNDQLTRLLGLEYIIEGKAKSDSTGNAASATYGYLWGKGCALLKIRPGAGRMQQSFGKTFRHTPLGFRDVQDDTRGVRGITWMIGTHEDADVITMADAGYLLDSVIS